MENLQNYKINILNIHAQNGELNKEELKIQILNMKIKKIGYKKQLIIYLWLKMIIGMMAVVKLKHLLTPMILKEMVYLISVRDYYLNLTHLIT